MSIHNADQTELTWGRRLAGGGWRERTFIVKAVNSVDGGTFMISAKDEKVFGVLDLVCEEKTNCLERLFAPIDIVAEKEVVCFWGKTTILE